MSDNALQSAIQAVAAIFYPLRPLNTAEGITEFLKALGYRLPDNRLFAELPQLIGRVENLVETVERLAQAESEEETLNALSGLSEAAVGIAMEIPGAVDTIKSAVASLPAFIIDSDIDQLPRRLLDYLLSTYLTNFHHATYGVLLFIGLLDEIPMPENAAKFQPEFTLRKVWWERLPTYFTEPQMLPELVYAWETGFDMSLFLERLAILLDGFRLPGGLYKQNLRLRNALANTTPDLPELRMPIFEAATWPDIYSQFGINVTSVEARGLDGAGFAVVPYIMGSASFDFDISDRFKILFEASAELDAGVGAVFRPDKAIEIMTNLFDAPEESLGFGLSLAFQQREHTPEITLIGEPNASRLAIEGPSAKVFVEKVGDIDLGFEIGLETLRLIISGGDGDGFISTILGDGGINAEAGFKLKFSTKSGLVFQGTGGLEVQLPAHISLGPLEILGILIALKIRDGSFVLEAGSDFKLELGPLAGVVENIGIKATLTFPEGGGNLGPADLAFCFKPPNGVGLSIDAGVVKGGGYLFFDFDREEYAGALELEISGFLTLKAIGLITTRMPDGSKGFSLLIIITAEFGSPFQLGFGFTLSGVGGLLGLNRTMRLQPLAEGVRTGSIQSIMFPTDVVANAPRIISDLRTFFPPQQGIFLIGPMAKLGWGTPNLITLSLGIIFEIPGNIAIVGVLKVALPDEDAALLVLQVNFIGAIEFDKDRAWFFASLFESRVLFMTIDGEMGLLIGWGSDANFVVSLGGFHPAYTPPPLPFPSPRRIAISILNTDYARVRVEAYFAVTSNTAQFGAAVEIFFGVSAFNIDGHLGLDALFQFSPFYFIVSISASLSVKVFGVGLLSVRMAGSIEGPTPWHIEGTGSLSLLFFDIDVDFSHTWGEEEDTTLPAIAVLPMLQAELEKPENWTAAVPAANQLLVSLRKIEADDLLVLHPVGTLKVSQRAIPLELTLDKVGAQRPGDADRFSLSIETAGFAAGASVEELFASAQFLDMDDARKLSSPAFEPQRSGLALSVAGARLNADLAVRRVVRYEQVIIDSNYKRFVKAFLNLFSGLFTLFLSRNAVARSVLSRQVRKQLQPFDDRISIRPNSYAVAFNTDNRAFAEHAASFTSKAKAEAFMREQVARDRNLGERLHVIPSVELEHAA